MRCILDYGFCCCKEAICQPAFAIVYGFYLSGVLCERYHFLLNVLFVLYSLICQIMVHLHG